MISIRVLRLMLFYLLLLIVLFLFTNGNRFEQNYEFLHTEPSLDYWFGTDSLGRDLFSRTVSAALVSLFVAGSTTVISMLIAFVVGATAALKKGRIDRILMRTCDVLYALPPILVAMMIVGFLGNGIVVLLLALVSFSWIENAKTIRGLVLAETNKYYIEAASSLGAKTSRILFFHILPNIKPSLLELALFSFAYFIKAEAFLGFLGIGLQNPNISLGVLLNDGWQNFYVFPHLFIFPAVILLSLSVGLTFIVRRKEKRGPS